MRSSLLALAAGALLAGCTLPGAAVDPAAAPDAEAATLLPLALRASGATDAYVCAYVVIVGDCAVLLEGRSLVPLEAPGRLARVKADVAWTETSPATMWIYLVGGDGTTYDEEPLEEAYGTPPLSIEWDLARRDHEAFALIVYSMTYEGLIVAGAGAAPPVGFRVEGMLLHEPPADETSI